MNEHRNTLAEDFQEMGVWFTESFTWSPGGVLIPLIGLSLGLCWGLYRYGRSLKYLYFYYIEHGDVVWSMESRSYRENMIEIVKKYKLSEFFKPHGYVSGLGIILACTTLGAIAGSLWPLTLAIGVLTIPNIVLRFIAREKRAKAVFQQNLQGNADGNA